MFSRFYLRRLLVVIALILMSACQADPTPIPTLAPSPQPMLTPQVVITVPPSTATPTRSPIILTQTPTPSPAPTPAPSALEQYLNNLHDLARLPLMEQTIATQFTSRNWVALEHFFDWFIDDGNFDGPNYGYIGEDGKRRAYQIVRGYDGKREYEIVPRVEEPVILRAFGLRINNTIASTICKT